MNVDLAKLLEQLFADIFRNGQTVTAVQIQDAAVDAGFSASDLDQVDWQQVYDNACEYPGVPAAYKGGLQTAPSSPPPTVHTVVQEVQTIQQVTNNNVNIFDNSVDNSVHVDNSIDFGEADIQVDGDLTIDQDNATAGAGGNANTGEQTGVAVGENATASGAGDANNASGGGGLINTGTNLGNQNTGDHAAQVGGTTIDLGFGEGAREPVVLRSTDLGGERLPGLPGDHAPDININTGSGDQDNSESFEHYETHGDDSPIVAEHGDGDQQVDQHVEHPDYADQPDYEVEDVKELEEAPAEA